MRTVHTTVYLYDELPTDKAKAAARDWMLTALRSAPDDSDFTNVLEKLKALSRDELLAALPNLDECKLTGFYADHDALQAVQEALKEAPDADLEDLHRAAEKAIEKLWDEEQESWSDKGHLEETIRGNDYEFTADGKRYVESKSV